MHTCDTYLYIIISSGYATKMCFDSVLGGIFSGACVAHELAIVLCSHHSIKVASWLELVTRFIPKSLARTMNLLCIALFGIFASAESQTFISPAVLSEGDVGACPSSDSLDSLRQTVKQEIATALQNIPSCPCGGRGQWTNIANFNFSDPNVACPSGFTHLTTPVRGCKQAPGQGPVCISAVFSSGGRLYSRVCGRVNGYQKGTTDAFHLSAGLRTLEQTYVEGVSLTHGAPGSRQHIWTFAAALYETASSYDPNYNCPCTNTEEDWPLEVYSYVGNNYFCATGNPCRTWT